MGFHSKVGEKPSMQKVAFETFEGIWTAGFLLDFRND